MLGYYWLLPEIGLIDALYMTVITLSRLALRDRSHERCCKTIYHILYYDQLVGFCLWPQRDDPILFDRKYF